MSNPSTTPNTPGPDVVRFLAEMTLVAFRTRTPASVRDTGEGNNGESRIEKVLQRIFDGKKVRPLGQIKQRAVRLLRANGSKLDLLDAWAIRDYLLDDTLKALRDLQTRWVETTNALVPELLANIEAWAKEHPADAGTIRRLAPNADQLHASTRFLFGAWKMSAEDVIDPADLASSIGDLPQQVFKELAQMIDDGGLHVPAKSRRAEPVSEVLRRVHIKAKAVGFLHPRIAETVDVLEAAIKQLDGLPPGKLGDGEMHTVEAIGKALYNWRKLLRDGWQVIVLKPAAAPAKKPLVAPLVKPPPVTVKRKAPIAPKAPPKASPWPGLVPAPTPKKLVAPSPSAKTPAPERALTTPLVVRRATIKKAGAGGSIPLPASCLDVRTSR